MTRTKQKRRTSTATKPAPRAAVLPVRPAPVPDFITEGQIRAHYEARLAGLPSPRITAWTPLPDGTHTIRFPSGAHITHTPGTRAFTAHTPCPQGAHHQATVTTGRELQHAETTAALCTDPHGQPRILTLAQAAVTAEDTQQLSRDDIDAGLTTRHTATDEQPKEHPES
ncbi:hypothetical protein [Streptomyces sp. NBC_01422]|uniref:hypothetical protein n=1 Tax=Streptomyces sp. NBC_01422 TaxID=2903859 RepID=UPI002E2BBDEA|nr:hypothetical protein [Streptomyces sp. NBC_01422]